MNEKLEQTSREQQSFRDCIEHKLGTLSEKINKQCQDIKDELHIEICQLKDQFKCVEDKVFDAGESIEKIALVV